MRDIDKPPQFKPECCHMSVNPHTVAVLPRMFRVRQRFDSDQISDVTAAVHTAFDQVADLQSQRIQPSASVAIAVGSRGISKLNQIVRAVVETLRQIGANPFIVPAMGSHGGATAEGQAKILAGYGVDEASMGCPVRSSMQTLCVGHTESGVEIHVDQIACEADHVVLVNRIKPHTRISGPYESGLIKMLMIGLGKHRGAEIYHRAMVREPFDQLVPQAVSLILSKLPVLCGVGIIENAFDEPARIEVVPSGELLQREPELLADARRRMPSLPFNELDLVIIDQIGKNISGAGMDTNVVGRKFNDKVAGIHEWPKVQQIYVRGLTSKTGGNATGIGIAEYCRSQVVRQMDVEMTRINCLTALHATAAAVPIHWETDREVLSVAMDQCGRRSLDKVRCVWLPNTLHLDELVCSEALWDETQTLVSSGRLSILNEPQDWPLDSQGNLQPAFQWL